MKINKKNIFPVVIMILVYLASYYIPKVAVSENRIHFVIMEIDKYIPLFSPASIIYVGAFFQWIIAVVILLCMDENKTKIYTNAVIIGSLISFVVFMVYPTAVHRDNIEINNFFDYFLSNVYKNDSILNSLPSLHCMISTIVLFIFKDSNLVSNKFYIFNVVYSILVFISTLLTKQHYFIDVPTGIALGIISIFIAKQLNKKKAK